jgi:hypothetical protein
MIFSPMLSPPLPFAAFSRLFAGLPLIPAAIDAMSAAAFLDTIFAFASHYFHCAITAVSRRRHCWHFSMYFLSRWLLHSMTPPPLSAAHATPPLFSPLPFQRYCRQLAAIAELFFRRWLFSHFHAITPLRRHFALSATLYYAIFASIIFAITPLQAFAPLY